MKCWQRLITNKEMNLIFDTHAHYDDKVFDEDREALLSGLSENGVGLVVNASARADEVQKVLDLAHKYDFIYASVGVHPSEVYELTDDDYEMLYGALDDPKAVAVGEIGLDYHYDDTDKTKQKHWFERQIDLAKQKQMPLIVHSRDAAADTLEVIKSSRASEVGGVIHCFSYESEIAKIYLDMGFYIGIGGVLTFKNSRKLKEVVTMMPMEQMLLETDCPYLAPVPFRGERNDSTMIKYVVSVISQLKGIDEDEVRRITYENACRMYRIKK